MQAINSAALDSVAARVLGCSPELVPFYAMGWDARDAVKEITPTNGGTGKARKSEEKKLVADSRPHPIFKVGRLPAAKLAKMQEQDKQARLVELEKQYQSSAVKDKQGNMVGGFEVEPTDYMGFAAQLGKAFREQTGEIPLFLLDEDTLFQVMEEGAEVSNLRDLL